jgi:hypothetical protein
MGKYQIESREIIEVEIEDGFYKVNAGVACVKGEQVVLCTGAELGMADIYQLSTSTFVKNRDMPLEAITSQQFFAEMQKCSEVFAKIVGAE